MDGITGNSAILDKYGYFASQQAAAATQSDDNVFLQILVTQLKNQDPLEPLGNGEFIQQMASFSAVEETAALNDQIKSLVALQEIVAGQNAFTQSADLVGKTVTYIHPESGETLTGFVSAVNLDENGLTLDIGGTSVPVSSVTGLLADESGDGPDDDLPDDDQEEDGDSSSDDEDEN